MQILSSINTFYESIKNDYMHFYIQSYTYTYNFAMYKTGRLICSSCQLKYYNNILFNFILFKSVMSTPFIPFLPLH